MKIHFDMSKNNSDSDNDKTKERDLTGMEFYEQIKKDAKRKSKSTSNSYRNCCSGYTGSHTEYSAYKSCGGGCLESGCETCGFSFLIALISILFSSR